ncbi:MAG: PKD domain-containing protein [Candidatus Saccharibacteria bacterium]|nr:PKD domain-containing protein [Candidatus Saccharibacteria bacterium]
MKSLFSRMSLKVSTAIFALFAVVGIGAVAGAWYPERPTYTIDNPAPHVTFNSVTDNPNYGDERTFFDAKDASNTNSGGFVDRQNVQNGQELLLRVYVHNNAASSLNGENFDGKGVAKNTQVRVHLPSATDNALRANAYISADNATPKVVSDTVDFASEGKFNLEYVPGSATAYTNAVPSGMKLSDNIVTSGAKIGHKSANGVFPGCFEYTAIVTIKVKVKQPRYTVDKQVTTPGSTDWRETLEANPGDTVSWLVTFKNEGATELKNVKVVDEVPEGLTVVPGTVKLVNGNYPDGYVYPDSAIQANGRQVNVDIGNYKPGVLGYVTFRTKIADKQDLECGRNEIVNKAFATPADHGAIWDTAETRVNKECDEPEEPVYACDALSVKRISKFKYEFSANATAENGASIKQYRYDFGDGTEELVTDKSTVTYTYAEDGTYNARLTVDFTVDGEMVSDSGQTCEATITIDKETPDAPEEPEQPNVLPSTGPADMIGIFAAVSVAGGLAHKIVYSRRYM